jgi:hypothetical protein
MSLVPNEYLDGGMLFCITPAKLYVGVVSRALTWATRGDAPVQDSRIRRPFQTHSIGFGRSSLFKSTRFHFDTKDIRTQEGSGEPDIVIDPDPAPPIHWEYIGQGKKILVDPSPQTASLLAIQERVREALKKALASEDACHRRSLSSESHVVIQRDGRLASESPLLPGELPNEQSRPLSPIQEQKMLMSPTAQFDHLPSEQPSSDSQPHVRFILPPVTSGLKKSSYHKPYHVAANMTNMSSLYQADDFNAIQIQRVWRGYIVRKRLKLSKVVHSIFDPYFHNSYGRNKLKTGWTIDRLPSFGTREVSFSN